MKMGVAFRRAAVALTLLLALTAALSGVSVRVASAQQGGTPLLFNYKGDLWSWDGKAIKARTSWGYNDHPILSPDGRSVAYLSVAKVAVDQIRKGNGMSGYLPQNIYVLDIATNQAVRVADQPADATYGSSYNFITRSQPSWAPDSSALAWTELVESTAGGPETNVVTLVIYDLAKKQPRKLASIPIASDVAMIPAPLDTAWGKGGIAVMNFVAGNGSAPAPQLRVYSPAGKLTVQKGVKEAGTMIWLDDNGTPLIGLEGATTRQDGTLEGYYWAIVNPAGGEYAPLTNGVPALRGVGDPGTNGPALFSPNSIDPTLTWEFTSSLINPTQFEPANRNLPVEFAIAPDHTSAAFVQDGQLMVVIGSKLMPLKDSSGAVIDATGVAWGPIEWFILHG